MTSPDTRWGPEIPVDGKRPEWLGDDDHYLPTDNEGLRIENPRCEARRAIHHLEWQHTAAIRLPADHPHYQQADADTVTIKRMTKDEAKEKWVYPGCASANTFVIALEAMGLIKADPTPLDRFMAAHPTADRATAEKALEWGREG